MLSLSKEFWRLVFPFSIVIMVFTTSSVWPLDWGYATKDSRYLTRHDWRNSWNMLEVKGGSPSVLSSSGLLHVVNSQTCWQKQGRWRPWCRICRTKAFEMATKDQNEISGVSDIARLWMSAYHWQRGAQDVAWSAATRRHEKTIAETRPRQNACRGCGSC